MFASWSKLAMLHANESWFTEAGTNCNAFAIGGFRFGYPEAAVSCPRNSHNGMSSRVTGFRRHIDMWGIPLKKRVFGYEMKALSKTAAALVVASIAVSGCTSMEIGDTMYNGYVVDQQSLNLIPVGSSREQVILTMGTPSTTATFDTEVFYYISQKRHRRAAFMKPQIVEQSVLAIYFDKNGVVAQRANYALQDGKVFDTISRTTPTGGRDLTFLQQLLSGGSGAASGGAGQIRNMLQSMGN
jgi:outer membrane protein assembly factor BamE (lipoprotein component of BamABCDE complex)